MSPLTFAISTATRNYAQTFSYFIPPNSVGDHHSSLSNCYRTTLMVDYIIPVLIQQQNLCYDLGSANLAQTPSCLIPSLFCLSILKTFIPHSKIYRTTNDWQNAKCLLIPCITVFPPLRRPTQRLPLNSNLYLTFKIENLQYLRSIHIFLL